MNTVEIHALAEGYAQKYNPERVTPFPYENVTRECQDLDVFFIELEDENVSGAILYKDGRFSMLVNTNKHTNRQNFTLAHELGHYFLHKEMLTKEGGFIDSDNNLDGDNVLYRLDGADQSKLETEANHFAASLIMPRDLVMSAWGAISNIEECARIFKVSTIAMTIRLSELGLVE